MTDIDEETIKAFCNHCDWAYQCWLLRKHLYDENPQEELLKHPHHSYFFIRLEKILQEYWLQEVAKLHDPATQYGNDNLSVEYIFKNGNWPPEVKDKLDRLKDRLDKFASNLKDARNKILAHKDKNTILSGVELGEFQEGEDVAYFEALNEFASEAYNHIIGGPYPFDDLTKNDIDIFMATFSKGLA